MICHRCRGLLINDQSDLITRYDLSEASSYVGPTLRCINCGYVEDPVVRPIAFTRLWQVRWLSRKLGRHAEVRPPGIPRRILSDSGKVEGRRGRDGAGVGVATHH